MLLSSPKARLITFSKTRLMKFLSQQFTHDRSYIYLTLIFGMEEFIAYNEAQEAHFKEIMKYHLLIPKTLCGKEFSGDDFCYDEF